MALALALLAVCGALQGRLQGRLPPLHGPPIPTPPGTRPLLTLPPAPSTPLPPPPRPQRTQVSHLLAPLVLDHRTEPLLITPVAGIFSLSAFKVGGG